MPELPEVETVKNVLSKIVINRTIKSIEVLNKRQIDGDVNSFISTLTNQTFLSLSRKGKYLIFHLTNDIVLISHLRMEGKYFEYLESEPNSPYARVIFHLDNNHKLCYDDSRTFGILKLSTESNFNDEPELSKLGPEPFVANYKDVYQKAKNLKTKIKTAILDQTLITGLGNIYVDEALYDAHINPHTPTYLISEEDWKNIINSSIKILNKAIELGGSTIKSYHPGKDIDGNFQTELKIYGKKDYTCPKCGKTFVFTKTNGRGTTYCPGCQHKLGTPLNIGLTGKIASGKSEALNLFNKKGFDIISSDEIVHELYKKEEVISKINKMFSLNFKDEVNHKELRDYLLTHNKDIKRLERFIHPLVRKEIEKTLSKSKKDIRIVEVPLLFKAHYEDMFDSIIVIDIDEDKQLERLTKRNGEVGILLKEINANNAIEENKNKAEFLVLNNEDLKQFSAKIDEITCILKSRLG